MRDHAERALPLPQPSITHSAEHRRLLELLVAAGFKEGKHRLQTQEKEAQARGRSPRRSARP